ncbi:MAG: TonB-dependent receptor, partial [Pseudomonadota bacterium]|nr:TonB-dependent receptor [Pseudomonadota bacterium]
MASHKGTRFNRSPLTLALAVAMLLPAGAAIAQQQTPPEAEVELTEAQKAAVEAAKKQRATNIDGVTVVGSRIKRVEVEGPSPVTIISRVDIEREGFKTVGDMLQTITQNTTSSFTGDEAVNGFSPNAQVVNLRNLGPGFTLTLINGRRPAQYPQPYNRDNNVVNIRAIPSSIIERVEILTGGASAIYGSDAVAGVVNIVTRKNFDGNAAKVTLGTTEGGGGDSVNLELAGGRTGDRWSAMYALQYGDTKPVFASQRDFLSDTRNGPNGPAFTNPSLSLVALRVSTHSSGPLNHNAFYPGAAVCDQYDYTTVTTPARGLYCGSFTQVASRSIANKNRFYSGYTSGTFDLTDNLQLFGSATYYASDASSSSGTEFWGTSGDRFNQTRTGGTTTAYFDPSFGHLVQLQRVFNPFELGGEQAAVTLYDESTYDVNFGITGSIADRFDWEASVSHSEYNYSADRPRLLAKAVHDYFLGPRLGFSGNFPIHVLNRTNWVKPLTPELYQSLSTRVVNEGDTGSSTFNFNIAGEVFNLPAGPVGFAGVLEAGRQTVDLRSDPRLNPLRPIDEQTVYNLVSSGRTEGQRDRYALGLEFRVPVFSKLMATLASRYDKYDDITEVDDAVSYMAGLEYRPFSNLLLRGSYSTSFRAPDMQLVFAEGAASFSGVLDQLSCRAGTGPAAALGPRTLAQCNVGGDPTIYTTQTT